MLLSAIAEDLSVAFTGEDREIVSVEYDSRKVLPGSLFCCMRGEVTDGHKYAGKAVEAGAAALICEHPVEADVPQLIVSDAREGMALASACFFGHPEKQMRLFGITGTNGKTSTTYMFKSAAERAGHKVGLIGTIQNLIGNDPVYTERTTPESRDMYALLRRMADAGMDTVIMEVSSHALAQQRVGGLQFTAGVFTNLTQDHLDYHKTFENYRAAKKKLFFQSDQAILNSDDPAYAYMSQDLPCPLVTFGLSDTCTYYATDIDITPHGASFTLHTPEGTTPVSLQISGLFSVYNALGTAALCRAAGISLADTAAGLSALPVISGRLEQVRVGELPFTVYVDYAHTPDALVNVLRSAHAFTKGRLICLFGCGGDRDHGKRPLMGEAAGQYSDFVVVTTDNPRSEDPVDIIRMAEPGVVKTGTPYTVIVDRREAIAAAIDAAGPGDVVMIAGKGHETYQEVMGVRRHFDDKEIASEYLRRKL